jgi:predicted nucleic acid-binding protein
MADLVVDASIAVSWCYPDEPNEYSNGVLRDLGRSKNAFVPRLWAYEVRNSILTGIRRGRVTRVDAEAFLDSLRGLRIHLVDPVSYDAVFKLAETNGLTVYDAAYIDLAIREGAQLASLDEAMKRAALRAGLKLYKTALG